MDECKPLVRGAAAGDGGVLHSHGRAVQVEPIKPTSKAPGTKRSKLKCKNCSQISAFKFNVRRYSMEVLSRRLHRLLAAANGAAPDFFEARIDRHCSNLQVANYPTIQHERWGGAGGVESEGAAEGDGSAAGESGGTGQGLTLVHFLAQPEPFLTQNTP